MDSDRQNNARLRPQLAGCTVLLKSDGSFPLSAPCPLALFGSGARHTVQGGTGSGEVNCRDIVTIEQGLEAAGFTITSKDWLDRYDLIRQEAGELFVREIRAKARKQHTLAIFLGMGAVQPEPEYMLALSAGEETAVYVLSRNSGEGNDRQYIPGDILLTETEIRDILTLSRTAPRFLLVLNTGGPVDLSPVEEVKNVLLLSQLGAQTGTVLADLLLGKSYPSGKLTTTWPRTEDLPEHSFGDREDTEYREGIYVGYRYYDTLQKEPLFPFGFGLSYTSFSLGKAECGLCGDCVMVRVPVRNTGNHPGREVVQVYVSVPAGKLDQPYQTLATFGKTAELAPGETEEMELTFAFSSLAGFDREQAAYVLEKGSYVVHVGNGSRSTVSCAVLELGEDVPVRQVRSALGDPGFRDFAPPPRPVCTEGLPCLTVEASALPRQTISYDAQPEPDARFASLSPEELAFLGIGAFDPKGGLRNVIGEASLQVAGAAGESCPRANELGLPSLVMADGPAGLRLTPDYWRDEKGVHGLAPVLSENMAKFLPAIARPILGRKPKLKKGMEVLHQYATSLPIGTALAQSFDLSLAYLCGDIVGGEMQQFCVQLWLAPALNIHRDIRCGRNFEYYSEDPLLSGRMAAAITNGVQSHPGCGTCIKHYAANNQETNRYGSNSHVSERAMRELYLRGFRICVERSHPVSLMTSYNLLNGTHTSERKDLIEDVLRSEFGFDGLVMTDWVVAAMTRGIGKYGPPTPWKVAAAGNDLFMPGSKEDYQNVLQALKEGTLPRRVLEVNATRLLHTVQRLSKK